MYEAEMRDRNQRRADLIEDLLSGVTDSVKGVRAAKARVAKLRET